MREMKQKTSEYDHGTIVNGFSRLNVLNMSFFLRNENV